MSTRWDQIRATSAALTGRRGRYAPSPTGQLHLGNVRTALVAWLHARLTGSTFIMRIEDLDEPRAQPGGAQQMMEDLAWLGLDWDEGPDIGGSAGPYVQSERKAIYEAALEHLHQQGQTFACYCSRKDIQEASSAPHGDSPVYPGTCRDYTDAERAQVAHAKQRAPSWRLLAPARTFALEDQVYGHYAQRLDQDVGDFMIKRVDGFFAYQLAVVVDDLLMGITDVVRGQDLLDSTPRQLLLFELLGAPCAPSYWHVPLMLDDESGQKLSKRDGSLSIGSLRAQGKSQAQIIGALASSLGLWQRDEPATPKALLEALKDEQTLRERLRSPP